MGLSGKKVELCLLHDQVHKTLLGAHRTVADCGDRDVGRHSKPHPLAMARPGVSSHHRMLAAPFQTRAGTDALEARESLELQVPDFERWTSGAGATGCEEFR